MSNTAQTAYKAALAWYVDSGVDEVFEDSPVDRTKIVVSPHVSILHNQNTRGVHTSLGMPGQEMQGPSSQARQNYVPLGASDARAESVKLAQAVNTLEELREAIATFEGISLKKTATNLVFSDGNPKASVMLIGEAPGAEEDRIGRPFVGQGGLLLDRIFKCIGLERSEEDPEKSLYIANVLNWRPPGNRTPSPGEVEASLPFIERHIQLIQPKIIVLCGAVPAKALLGRADGISRMRKLWHDYETQTPEFKAGSVPIPAIVTYQPDYLLRTPSQKKAAWADMLMIQQKCKDLSLL